MLYSNENERSSSVDESTNVTLNKRSWTQCDPLRWRRDQAKLTCATWSRGGKQLEGVLFSCKEYWRSAWSMDVSILWSFSVLCTFLSYFIHQEKETLQLKANETKELKILTRWKWWILKDWRKDGAGGHLESRGCMLWDCRGLRWEEQNERFGWMGACGQISKVD